MQNILDKKQIEQILISRWSEFLSARKLIQFAKESLVKNLLLSNSCQITKISLSRFEPVLCGFLLWLDIIIIDSNNKINITIEASLSTSGDIQYLNCDL